MIKWRSIQKDGFPTNENIGYLVSDGNYIEYSDISLEYGLYFDKKPKQPKSVNWVGGSVYALYTEVSGTEFDFEVKYWCPVTELNLPQD